MADESQEICEECEAGAPEWMVTFADLATLLLCFFVLLLSFSRMDTAKFKELRGSLKRAFGVQRVLPVYETPKGMKFIAKDFDQAFVEQAVSHDILTDYLQDELNITKSADEQELFELVKNLKANDIVDVEMDQYGRIVMRLLGQTTFASGQATIKATMIPILDTIGEAIGKTKRQVLVAGHTDNVPLQGGPFGSNLGLSAARAAAVVEFFLSRNKIPPHNIATMAYGEHRPLVANNSSANREKNRRVEIILAAMDHAQK